jgi:hypothetical protein
MAPVNINQGMPAPEESALEVSRDRWQLLAMARRRWAEVELPFDCRLLKLVQDEAPILAEAMGYESGDQFLTGYLNLDMDLVCRVVGWLEQEQPEEAVTLQIANEQAIRDQEIRREAAGGKTQQQIAEEFGITQGRVSQVISPCPNRPRPNRQVLQLSAGTDPALAAARIRERLGDDFADSLTTAVQAGILKPVPVVRLTDPVKAAARIHAEWSADQINALIEALLSLQTP